MTLAWFALRHILDYLDVIHIVSSGVVLLSCLLHTRAASKLFRSRQRPPPERNQSTYMPGGLVHTLAAGTPTAAAPLDLTRLDAAQDQDGRGRGL